MQAVYVYHWPMVIAVLLFNIKIRDERSENEPLKRWIASVDELSQRFLSLDHISSPAKSLVLHASKSGDFVLNLDQWLWTTLDQMSAVPRSLFRETFWPRVQHFVAHLDSHPIWPLFLRAIAHQTQLPLEVVRDYAQSLDAAFQWASGVNVTAALRWAFDVTVDSWILRYHLFRLVWTAQNRMLSLLYERLSLWVQRLLENEDFRQDLTSFELLEGISVRFRYFRDTFFYRRRKRETPAVRENFLQLDPARGVWYNLEKAVTNYVWLITTSLADAIRWTLGTSEECVIGGNQEL